MKIRQSFVSNSSSSSFVINAKKITAHQLYQIENYEEISKEYQSYHESDDYCSDNWYIDNHGGRIELSTHMDNFDMREFLDYIGVPEDAIID